MTKSQSEKYDLEERTAKFGESVINICKEIPHNTVNKPLINQLVKSSTSVGANYSEDDDAESPKDFKHKIGICKKVSRESKYFIRKLATAEPKQIEKLSILWKEAKELNLIFNAIYRKLRNK